MIRLILSVLMLGGAYLIFSQFTDPSFKKMDGLRADAARFDVALTKANELRAERAKLQSKFNLFSEEEKQKLAKFLPETIDTVRLIIDIDRIAAARSLRITNVSISTSEVGGESRGSVPYGVAGLTFGVQTTYEQYIGFLHDLEASLRLTDVMSIAFTASPDSPEYTYTTKINTYWILPNGRTTVSNTTSGNTAP